MGITGKMLMYKVQRLARKSVAPSGAKWATPLGG